LIFAGGIGKALGPVSARATSLQVRRLDLATGCRSAPNQGSETMRDSLAMNVWVRIGSALLLEGLAASAASAGDVRPQEKIALYTQPLAFMNYCDMKVNPQAFEATIAAVGIKPGSIPAMKADAEKLVKQLQDLNDTKDKKIAFCRTSKTIPVIKQWTAAD
jgi:hypothetical protein